MGVHGDDVVPVDARVQEIQRTVELDVVRVVLVMTMSTVSMVVLVGHCVVTT